ncbi:hypothetical protein F5B17DRAFT_166850 [Nemania serpens]|nr:hypothetical protein F5B17DRAFT_166850 [Nemania serpens]
MSSSQLEEFDRFWARQGTSMSDHHLEERMRFNRETEAKKQRVIDNARLQLEDLRKRDLPPADFDHEAHKIGEARDVALVSIEKDHNERMRIVIDIQLKEVANHEKAHKEAIAVRSFMNATLPVHPAQAPMAAAAASPAVGNVEAANSGYITSGSRTPASMETGPPSHHTLLDNAFSTIRVSREQDRPAASEKTFSCTAQREFANGEEQYILRYKTKNRKALQKFPNFRTKPSPHADQSVVTSALTATKEPLVSRTITFDEVYQNGQAEHKDTIVEFPAESGQWYILKCEEHNLRFKQRPLQGAAKHLNGQLHGCLERAWPTAIRMLGYRVIDCTAAAAKKNNEAVDEAFANGYKPAGLQKIKKNRKRADAIPKLQGAISRAGLHGIASFSSSSGRRKTSQIEGITNPKAFHVYCCLWRPRFYPVVILGWDDQKPGGLEVRLSGTGLLDKTSNPPSCYIYHNAAIVGWAPGFEDGGPKVNQRKFPAMFLCV